MYTICDSLSSFYISGATLSFLNDDNGDKNWYSENVWSEASFNNAPYINSEQYLQAWMTTWYPSGSEVAHYLFLVGPKLSGEPVFEIYDSIFTTSYEISGDGPILTSNAMLITGVPGCPNSVTWPNNPNIAFSATIPGPPPVLSNNPGLTFEQVVASHGGLKNFLRLRNLGYF
jgi:hypothetical protein